MTDPLSIAAFLDGRLGHEKQTRGVLQALGNLTAVDVQYRRIASLSFMSALKNWCLYGVASMIPRQRPSDGRADLIIGTGSYTHIPMLLLRRRQGGKVVTCMYPDAILARRMDLCFVPRHDDVSPAENIVLTTGPANPTTYTDAHDPSKGLILVGGIDKRSHRWDSKAVLVQVKTLIGKAPSLEWTISSSPRTPEDMRILLAEIARGGENIDFVRSEDTPVGWIEDAYRENDKVWVTADSISMIFEALSAGCRVGILPVQWKNVEGKFRRAERDLIENGWVQSYDMWLCGKGDITDRAPLDEAGRCAREILERWWPDRLP